MARSQPVDFSRGHPCVLIVGKRCSGKSTLVRHILQQMMPEMTLSIPDLRNEGVLSKVATCQKSVLLIDDMDRDVSKDDAVRKIFQSGRHYGCGAIVTCEPKQVTQINPYLRSNIDYLFFLSKPDIRAQRLFFAEELPPYDYSPGHALMVDCDKLALNENAVNENAVSEYTFDDSSDIEIGDVVGNGDVGDKRPRPMSDVEDSTVIKRQRLLDIVSQIGDALPSNRVTGVKRAHSEL